jgi:hypothetical protein
MTQEMEGTTATATTATATTAMASPNEELTTMAQKISELRDLVTRKERNHNASGGASDATCATIASEDDEYDDATTKSNFADHACEFMAKSVLDTFNIVGRGAVVVLDYAEREWCAPAMAKWNAQEELLERIERINELLGRIDGSANVVGGGDRLHRSRATNATVRRDVCSAGMMCGDDVVPRSRSFFGRFGLGGGGGNGGNGRVDETVDRASAGTKTRGIVDGWVGRGRSSTKTMARSSSVVDLEDVVDDIKRNEGASVPPPIVNRARARSRSLVRMMMPGKSRKQKEEEEGGKRPPPREEVALSSPGEVKVPDVPPEEEEEEPPVVVTDPNDDDVASHDGASGIENGTGDVVNDEAAALIGSSTSGVPFPDHRCADNGNLLGRALCREVDDRVQPHHESFEMDLANNSILLEAGGGGNDVLWRDALSSPVLVASAYPSSGPSCGWCGLSGGDDPKKVLEVLKICSACQGAYYCGTDCQSKDWINGHAEFCRAALKKSNA